MINKLIFLSYYWIKRRVNTHERKLLEKKGYSFLEPTLKSKSKKVMEARRYGRKNKSNNIKAVR